MSDSDKPEGEVVRVDFGARRAVAEPLGDKPPTSPHDQEKLAVFTRMIDRGLVMVTFDARAEGVAVPEHLAEEPQLALNFSHRFGIADFDYDEQGVRASLSFAGRDVFCDVPWSSVWMMRSQVDGELAISPDSVPPEIQAALAQANEELEAAREADAADKSAQASTPALGLPASTGPSGAKAAGDVDVDAKDDGGDDDKPPGGGLRLVKG